eukprot:712064-Pleurochrysis_carterae.AAC.2
MSDLERRVQTRGTTPVATGRQIGHETKKTNGPRGQMHQKPQKHRDDGQGRKTSPVRERSAVVSFMPVADESRACCEQCEKQQRQGW